MKKIVWVVFFLSVFLVGGALWVLRHSGIESDAYQAIRRNDIETLNLLIVQAESEDSERTPSLEFFKAYRDFLLVKNTPEIENKRSAFFFIQT